MECGGGEEILYKWSRSHDQDGRKAFAYISLCYRTLVN